MTEEINIYALMAATDSENEISSPRVSGGKIPVMIDGKMHYALSFDALQKIEARMVAMEKQIQELSKAVRMTRANLGNLRLSTGNIDRRVNEVRNDLDNKIDRRFD